MNEQAKKQSKATDPISRLRSKVATPPGPAQADQVIPPDGKPKETTTDKDNEFLDDDFLPALGGPVIVSAHIGLTARLLKAAGRTCEPPDDDRKEAASTKASAWLRLKLGKVITLGPTGQMFVCLMGLSTTMYLESEPIKPASPPPPPPPPKPAQPSAAPVSVAVTPSAPVGNTAPPVPTPRPADLSILGNDPTINV